jgi:hypothetical protein
VDFLIVLASLVFLMFVAYRGYSVILFAPVAAMGAVLFIDPNMVAPMFTGLFMDKMVGFVKNFFPVFLLGAVFGKVIELSGFSKAIVASVIKIIGRERAMLAIIVVCAVLTYGGVSLFVVVFAVYPFAAEMFRQGWHSKAPDSRHYRPWRLHLHYGLPAWHAADSKYYPDYFFQDRYLRCSLAGRDWRHIHPDLWPQLP